MKANTGKTSFLLMTFIVCFSTAFAQGSTAEPVARYCFDGNALDSSVNALHLTVVGNPQLCTDRHENPNTAYQLDGMGDYFQVDDNPLLRPQNFTISAWFSSEFKADYTRIIEKRYRVPLAPYGSYILELSNDSALPKAHVATNGAQNIINSPQTVDYNSWHLLCATYDGTDFKLYLDGEICNTMPLQGTIPYSDIPLCIGAAYPDAPNSNHFKGKLDEIRIYDFALTEPDIREMFDLATAPQNVVVVHTESGIQISWESQSAVSSYSLYSTENYLLPFPGNWTLEASGITSNIWTDTNPESAHKFYRLTALQ